MDVPADSWQDRPVVAPSSSAKESIPQADLLTGLLRDVSRSFYLTLRILPAPIRRQIGLAYLLARATDTIADTEILSLRVRLDMLYKLRARIMGQALPPLDLGKIADQQGTAGERTLLKRIEEALHILEILPESDRELVREVLATITSGQELDLQRFATADSRNVVALQADAELDDYTYRVAGCVGEFWTKMCLAHLSAPANLDRARLIENGIRYGKGLQLVNILRDISADLLKGRCYIPRGPLAASAKLRPADLTNTWNMNKFRPLYEEYLNRAELHLAAGWQYTNALPFRWMRVRLACAWPILIGLRTLSHLRHENPLDGARRVKVSRTEVKSLIALSTVSYPLPVLWRRLYRFAGSQH
jgi:farnesyl-diphosphate farnesyltransferase